jgi:hypothetical protein
MGDFRFLRGRGSKGLADVVALLKERGHQAKRTKLSGSRYRGSESHTIINWGATSKGNLTRAVPIFNRPECVGLAVSKLQTMKRLSSSGMGQYIPKWTDSLTEATRWFTEGSSDKVYCRTLTRSSQGRGIVIAHSIEELVGAPLFTSYVPSDREIRVHVFQGVVIDFAQKKKMSSERREAEGIESVNDDVRSHENGWVFAREGISINDIVKQVAIQSVSALGLDFGAVDIIITPQGVPKVLEINTAPGLEGTTLESYALAIEQLCLN